jgi:hypothetical protein
MLSDGRILFGDDAGLPSTPTVPAVFTAPFNWWILTPDSNGNYHTGTFARVRTSFGAHLYSPLALANDGEFYVFGGEYQMSSPFFNTCELFRTRSNVWELLPNPPWPGNRNGDDAGQVLNDGRLFVVAIGAGSAIFDPATGTWTSAASQPVSLDEASNVLLPNGAMPFTDCFNPPATYRYDPGTNTWFADANTTTDLIRTLTAEIGPWILLPDGRAWLIGGNGHTNYYTPNASPLLAGTFAAGPDLPIDPLTGALMQINDGDGLLQVDGTIFFFAGPNGDTPPVGPGAAFPSPAYTLVGDPIGNTVTRVADAPGGLASNPSLALRTIMLPTGDILVFFQGTLAIWNTGAGPNNAWRPTITKCPKGLQGGQTYSLTGTQLNGIARSNSGGDDYWQNQLPLIRITHVASGTVTYCRSYGLSTLAVATGGAPITMKFTVPLGIPLGPSTLEVVSNGIANQTPVAVTVFPQTRFGVSGIGIDSDHSVPANVEVAELQVARGAISWPADGPGPALTQDTTTTGSGRTAQLAPQCSTVAQGGATAVPSAPFSGGITPGAPVLSIAGDGAGSGGAGGQFQAQGGRGSPSGTSAGGAAAVIGGDGGFNLGAGGTGTISGGNSASKSAGGNAVAHGGQNIPGTGNPGIVRLDRSAEILMTGVGAVPVAPIAGSHQVAIYAKNTNPSELHVVEDDGTDFTIGGTGARLLGDFNTAGVYNVTVPANVSRIWGQIRNGAGGGAGGGSGAGGQQGGAAQTGGGGGGPGGNGMNCASEAMPACLVTPGDSLTITVGAGGTGGTGGAAVAFDTDGNGGAGGKAGGITSIFNATTGKFLIKGANNTGGGLGPNTAALSGTHGGNGGQVPSTMRGVWGQNALPGTAVGIVGPAGGAGGLSANGTNSITLTALLNTFAVGSDPHTPVEQLTFGGISAGTTQVQRGNTGAGGAVLGFSGGGGGGCPGFSSGTGDEATIDGVVAPLPTDGRGGDGGNGGSQIGPTLPVAGGNGTNGIDGRGGDGGGGGGGGSAGNPIGQGGAAGGNGGNGSDGRAVLFVA